MDIDLTADDTSLMLAEVQRFCQRTVRPLVARPECLLAAEQVAELTRQAIEMGLLQLDTQAGAGLWENPDCGGWRSFSSTALRILGHTNSGLAYHFHQLALGRHLRHRLGLTGERRSIACVQGTYGLARYSLARLLRRRPLTADDHRMLQDYFLLLGAADEGSSLLFQAADDWQELLVPCWDTASRFGWAVFAREELWTESLPHSHGLNETLTWLWQPRGEAPRHWCGDNELSLALYAQAFSLHSQALVAIALGAVQQGYEKAAEYAALRTQGGVRIQEHAAVRQMLGRCASAVQTVELLRQQVARLPATAEHLGAVVALRRLAHPLLCEAANEALQTFGGAGYLRETGLEKIVRDNNHLRLLCGTPDELLLFLSEWEARV